MGSAGDRTDVDCHAEDLHVTVRLITAPAGGTFLPGETAAAAAHPRGGDHVLPGPVAAGDDIGLVVRLGERRPVQTPFAGLLMGLLALPRERVRPHQPLAWLTTDEPV